MSPKKNRKGKQTLPLHEAGDQIKLRSQPVPDNPWQRWRMVRQDCLRYGALDHQHWENKLTEESTINVIKKIQD